MIENYVVLVEEVEVVVVVVPIFKQVNVKENVSVLIVVRIKKVRFMVKIVVDRFDYLVLEPFHIDVDFKIDIDFV